MLNNAELREKIDELQELEAMQDELKVMIDSIKDELKQHMAELDTDELQVGWNIMRFTEVKSQRFDTTAFKKKLPELYGAYVKQVTSRRFTIS